MLSAFVPFGNICRTPSAAERSRSPSWFVVLKSVRSSIFVEGKLSVGKDGTKYRLFNPIVKDIRADKKTALCAFSLSANEPEIKLQISPIKGRTDQNIPTSFSVTPFCRRINGRYAMTVDVPVNKKIKLL